VSSERASLLTFVLYKISFTFVGHLFNFGACFSVFVGCGFIFMGCLFIEGDVLYSWVWARNGSISWDWVWRGGCLPLGG